MMKNPRPMESSPSRSTASNLAVLIGLAGVVLPMARAHADLDSYVKAEDKSFEWKVENEISLGGSGVALVTRLTSQTWQGIAWKHWLTILRPDKVTQPNHALLLIAGGSTRSEPPQSLSKEAMIVAGFAQKTGSVVAVLSQVPNQPLFGNLKEDGLIAYTFQKFMETKDATWPCLLPMTKSAVRAMDVVQAIAKEKFSQDVKAFVVTGASKRGWTTWLTGAVDPRVAAIAPMVIDTLNISKQMPLQVKSFGSYSDEIADYTELNLPERLQEPGAKALLDLVDPYSFRKRLTMPKLILLGTNDRYWPVDAVKLYFGDLEGEKHIHYVPNAGHGLGPGAVEAIQAFYHAVVTGLPRPRFTWAMRQEGKVAVLAVDAKDKPLKAELWHAEAPTRDFRSARWEAAPMTGEGESRFVGKLGFPEKGFAALFGRLTYKSGLGDEYTLATNVEVLGD